MAYNPNSLRNLQGEKGDKGRANALAARVKHKHLQPFNTGGMDDSWGCVGADERKQFVIATATKIINEYRNGAAALIRLRELGSGHMLFDRVSRKIIAHI